MSYTAQDILTSSLRLIGVLASGESLGANEATDGLNALNDMLDSWSTNNLLIPNKVKESFTVTGGKQTYTMGPSGTDFITSRPMWIENISVQQGSGANALDIPVEIVTEDQWAIIPMKQIQSAYPLYCYPEGTYPNETLNFYPVPSQSDTVVIYSAKALSQLTSLTTVLSLPPGYARAIRYSLALELAPEYGKAIRDDVSAKAAAAVADIKRVNHRPKYLRSDDALMPRPAVFDWRTGGTV